jgi:hypothetical protein
MFKYLSLIPIPKPKPKTVGRELIRALRRLTHQRNYWKNRSLRRASRRRR